MLSQFLSIGQQSRYFKSSSVQAARVCVFRDNGSFHKEQPSFKDLASDGFSKYPTTDTMCCREKKNSYQKLLYIVNLSIGLIFSVVVCMNEEFRNARKVLVFFCVFTGKQRFTEVINTLTE